MVFRDRDDAGRQLAQALQRFREWHPVIVGLPRGGVPVACRVSEAFDAPLDVIVVRKLALPSDPEFAIGAIAEDGVIVFNEGAGPNADVEREQVSSAINHELQVLRRRVTRIRNLHPATSLKGRMVVIVDDGLATGASARAACRVAHHRGASSVVLAVPVAPLGWQAAFTGEAEDFQSVLEPEDFVAVGAYYTSFPTLNDDDLLRCLI